jgi:CMP-N-acetylneuraminic acid synthetase
MIDVTAVVFAKSISSRFPGKNLTPFAKKNGKTLTLLEWKIEQLIQVFDPDKIMLSSDSNEILDIGKKYKLKLQIRPLEIAEADFTTNLKYAAKDVVSNYFMYTNGPCYPLLFPDNYKTFLEYCSQNKKLLGDGIFGIEIIKGFLLYESAFLNFKPENMAYSQNVSNVERVVWGLALRETSMVLKYGALLSNPKNSFVIPNNNAIDIDYESDMLLAQAVLAEKHPESKL